MPMQRADVSSFIKKRRGFVGAFVGSIVVAGLLFLTGDKDAAIDELEAARRLAAAQLVCEVKLQRGETVDCSQIVVTPVAPPPADAVPVSFAAIPAAPVPEPQPIATAPLDVDLPPPPAPAFTDQAIAEMGAQINVLEEQLALERTARVDAESRADRFREALTAASEDQDTAVNNALNMFALELENERANEICVSRDRAGDLASLCSAAGFGGGLD